MIDRIVETESPSLRFALMFLGLPLVWVGSLVWLIFAGLFGLLRAPLAR